MPGERPRVPPSFCAPVLLTRPSKSCTSFCINSNNVWSRPRRPRSGPVTTPITPVCVTGADSPPLSSQQRPSDNNKSTLALLNALYKYTRPHTIRGTILGAFAGVARALIETPVIRWGLLPRGVLGLFALLFGNIFIVGINQIYDVRADRINKPFLPIAAGEMTPRIAWTVAVSSAVLGLAIVRALFSRLIFGLYAFGMTFGALYSIPPFRFRRFPLMAAITISCVRGFLMNFGVYHATKSAMLVPFAWSPPITFLAIFMSVFAAVIALAKDLPDIKGDRAAGVPTFAGSVGPRKMFNVVFGMLALNYCGAILTAFLSPAGAFNRIPLALGHIALGTWLCLTYSKVDPSSTQSVKNFYAFIWKLFYSEYILFPFI